MMKMSEIFCLKWNDFKENVSSLFGQLREDTEFTDITLVSEDGIIFTAHKLILASCPFFKDLFIQIRHPHPLIYMRGIKSENLAAILDFIYFGEANIEAVNLDYFFTVAEELKIKGITKQPREAQNSENYTQNIVENTDIKKDDSSSIKETKRKNHDPLLINQIEHKVNKEELDDARVVKSSADLTKLDDKIKDMMIVSKVSAGGNMGKLRICSICGKEGVIRNIKDHIEATHIDGFLHYCNLCEKVYKTRDGLRHHKRAHNL